MLNWVNMKFTFENSHAALSNHGSSFQISHDLQCQRAKVQRALTRSWHPNSRSSSVQRIHRGRSPRPVRDWNGLFATSETCQDKNSIHICILYSILYIYIYILNKVHVLYHIFIVSISYVYVCIVFDLYICIRTHVYQYRYDK